MNTHVALLYSVVLTPERRVVMVDLKAMAEDLGFVAPRTLGASGNLIFEAPGRMPVGTIEQKLEPAFAARFGRSVDIIVRSAAEFRALAEANPFRDEAETEPTSVHVRVMREPIGEEALGPLLPWRAPSERLAVAGGHLWLHLPDGAGTSKLAGRLTPRHMGGVGTTRNWNTVRRLAALVAGD